MDSKKTDGQLHVDVVSELEFEPSVHIENISVAALNGNITLSGSVPNYVERWSAEQAVKRVKGVTGVTQELTVNLFPDSIYTDADVEAAARNAIGWEAIPSQKPIENTVKAGIVTLEGEVDWQYQRQDAENAVARLRGVKGVDNQITLKVQVIPADIRAKIESAFERSANLDATQVRIAIDGGNVTLSGKLPTWRELEAATRAAWNTKGVTSVRNDIVLG